MKLITNIEHSIQLFYELEEFHQRTEPYVGMDSFYTDSLEEIVSELPDNATHKKEMIAIIQQFKKNKQELFNEIHNFFNSRKDIYSTYLKDISSFDYDSFNTNYGMEIIRYNIEQEIDGKTYIIQTITDDSHYLSDFFARDYNWKIEQSESFFKINDIEYSLTIKDDKTNQIICKTNNFNQQISEEQKSLIEKINVKQTEYKNSMQSILEKQIYKDYLKSRDFITQILTRTKHDNLLKQATQESILAFQQVITQGKIFQTSMYKNYQSGLKKLK